MLTVRIGELVESGILSGLEMSEACDYVLTALETITDQEEFESFLSAMAKRWDNFSDIASKFTSTTHTAEHIEDMFENRQQVQNS